MHKFVLSGLPEMDVSDIRNALLEKGLSLIDNKQMPIAKKAMKAKYLHRKFPVNINQQIQITVLCHVVIKWEHLQRTKSGPPVCNHCQNYGHAPANCNMTYRCRYCAQNHDSKQCPIRTSEETKLEPVNSKLCPKRLEFMNMQYYLNSKKQFETQRSFESTQPVVDSRNYIRDDKNFPLLLMPTIPMSPVFHHVEINTPNLSSKN